VSEVEEEKGVCPRCGTPADDGGRWCARCGLDLRSDAGRPISVEEHEARERDARWRAEHEASPPPAPGASPFKDVPAGAWASAALLVAAIVGAFGPWATALGFITVNGTRGDGWIVIAAAAVGLAALAAWLRGRERWWPLAVVVLGAVAATVTAGYDLHELRGAGDEDFFGRRVSLVSAEWGIYLALGAAAFATIAAASLLIDVLRRRRPVAVPVWVALVGAIAVANSAVALSLAVSGGRDDHRDVARSASAAAADDDAQSDLAAEAETPDVEPAPADDTAATPEPEPLAITEDEVRTLLDDYEAAYDAQDTKGLARLFSSDFTRRNADDPIQDRAQALATYREQFANLSAPQYVLSHLDVRDATADTATVDARYAITSAAGTVRGSATFTLVRTGDVIKIAGLEVEPD
jgi:hypothetical protein